ncbi:MAG: type I 3-dehydroquinate dehydratase [Candidatus Cryptobacteroides sp.]
MICTTIQNKDLDGICSALEDCEMAEIRLDRCPLSIDDIQECFSSDVPLVATCRVAEYMSAHPGMTLGEAAYECGRRLIEAIGAGAAFVDVEMEAPREMAKRVRKAAMENGTMFILSHHDFNSPGTRDGLLEMARKAFRQGADIVKIVTAAACEEDAEAVLSLYDDFAHGTLLAFCMGEAGKPSRLESLRRGAPYTYAALSESDTAAPGQWKTEDMRKAVYGNLRFVDGNCRMPSSKSFAQRAIIAAALSDGVSRLDGYTPCSDNEAAVRVARALGAEVTVEELPEAPVGESPEGSVQRLTVKGISAESGSVEISELNVGESGLLTRLMIPLVSQVASMDVTLKGEGTLLGRPLKGAPLMMSRFGVRLTDGESLCGDNDGDGARPAPYCKVPLKVCGSLCPGKAEISGKDGSQLISGLVMALPMAEGNSTLEVTSPKSIPYMFITLDVMKKFGVVARSEMSGPREFIESDGDWAYCTDMTFRMKGGQRYKAADMTIEGDWSAAANFLVAGAVFGKVVLHGLDTKSLQADLSIMDILMQAGASLSQTNGDRGEITVCRSPLSAFETDASNCPDLFPIVAVLAAFCNGKSRISGTDRLAHKESDRGKAILEMLTQMGVRSEIVGNALVVEGKGLAERCLTGSLLKGGSYTSHHDHRMVMALKVASLGADSPIEIDDEACVAKSFPGFFDTFSLLFESNLSSRPSGAPGEN